MHVEIREEPLSQLGEHSTISIAYQVDSVFNLIPDAASNGGARMVERGLSRPYVKDYDAFAGNRPTTWAERFDISKWGLLSTWLDGVRVGGAVIAFDTEGVDLLEGRDDIVAIWDLRICPDKRRLGLGKMLFEASADWARARGCFQLKVETQNINVAACRFYAKQGCVLGAFRRFAYPDLPDEVQLLWYKNP